jgi:hypothetical protein
MLTAPRKNLDAHGPKEELEDATMSGLIDHFTSIIW